jgi:hypothetical protein
MSQGVFMQSELSDAPRRRALLAAAVLLGGAFASLVAAGASAQAATARQAPHSVGRTLPAGLGLTARVPLSAPRVASRETIVLAPGVARVSASVGGQRFSIARPAGISPRVTCTLTAYEPDWYVNPIPGGVSGIMASAGISCDSNVSYIIGVVGLYSSGGSLLGDASTYDENTNALYFDYVFSILSAGYYSTGALGEVGDPIDGEFPEVYSPQIYVTAPIFP